MKIYKLIHKRPLGESTDHFDTKQIGIYSSFEKAHAVKEKYAKELDGFNDYPQYFEIEEIEVMELNNGDSVVYQVEFEISKGDYEEIGTIGFYPILEEAEQAKSIYLAAYPNIPESAITVGKCIIDKSYWVDGFFTYTY